MNKFIILIIIIIILGIYPAYLVIKKYQSQASSPINNSTPTQPSNNQNGTNNPPLAQNEVGKAEYNYPVLPIAEFKTRITRKPFGIYITPQNSPVSPEKFIGFHTGSDIEYQDVTDDVPVYAIADGTITVSRTASGYGGIIVMNCTLDKERSVAYGHIRPSSLPRINTTVKKGDQIGLLGTGYSPETGNERRHLHFGILSDDRTDITGYVQSESALSGWIDPTAMYQF